MIDYTPGKPDFNILRLGHIEYLVSDLAAPATSTWMWWACSRPSPTPTTSTCAPSRTASITAWC